jgi:hypothetical protein
MSPWDNPSDHRYTGRNNFQKHSVNRGRITTLDLVIAGIVFSILGIAFMAEVLSRWFG